MAMFTYACWFRFLANFLATLSNRLRVCCSDWKNSSLMTSVSLQLSWCHSLRDEGGEPVREKAWSQCGVGEGGCVAL